MPDAARRALLRVAAALATRDAGAVRRALEEARGAADATAVEEVILQSHLFVGFPDALNSLGVWREVGGSPAPPALGEDPASWEARGDVVCHAVYGANYGKLRENVRALHPDFEDWMVTGGYGRVIGRPGLELRVRELCIAALLAVWNVPRQLHSHLRGALNTGASVAEVDEAMEIACGFVAPEAAERVRALWGEIRAKAAASPEPLASSPD
ncbi:carboxymuconolactone decarboxylase family protein [Longimicrobium sp.]|uniref:carboxymuconolactone decarboxylase family protein n=1 Tax=Longimicrobium sp. TaxID=2029185 RepID=UPI002D1AF67F|nr:carboxymuconolactone decarboxylase family protein [Longimicrobium sp.]HSU15087.1 carboxymuconolactone decarboxylase family protein [Longimicrobium sp.]